MNFREIAAALEGRERAEDRLTSIYHDITDAEKRYLGTIEDQEAFRERAAEVNDWPDRRWGDDPIHGLRDDIDVTEDGITIRLRQEVYCRGCHCDTLHERITLPRYLIDAQGVEYDEALQRFINERARPILEYIEEQARQAEAERIAQEIAREEEERAEYLRLQAKYGEN